MENKKVPQLRFNAFEDDWEEKKLGEVSDRVTRKNENLESTLPLTISAQYGLVDQITFFNNQVASTTNLRNYFLVKNGEFAYNKSYSAGYPWGAIKRFDRYEKGVLSTLYIVFKPKNINSDYLLSYYDTDKWYKQVSEIAAEGARNHGLLNIAPNDFFQTTFYAPKSENEQQKIGTMLSKIDSLIQAKTKKLESLKSVKKSLLQKCFPKDGEKIPQMRFKGFSEDWEESSATKLFETVSDKGHPELPVLSASQELGMIYRDNFKSDIQYNTQNTFGYKRVCPKQFVIHLRSFQGGFAHSKIEGITSPAYTVLKLCDEKKHDDIFWKYVLTSESFIKNLETIIYGIRDGKSISFDDFSTLVFIYPSSKNEQQKIGQFFSKYDSLISAQQKEIDNLKTIKKSLLQKMFV